MEEEREKTNRALLEMRAAELRVAEAELRLKQIKEERRNAQLAVLLIILAVLVSFSLFVAKHGLVAV